MNTLTWIAVGIFVLVHVWLLWITRQMRRESEASLAECRRVEARIAALAAEALGRPRP